MTTGAMRATGQAVRGAELKAMLQAALENLRRHREEVNALNVFPVPDGDTGANMVLTMQAAWKAIEGREQDHAGEIMRAAAHGAIRGARGNSGVILSQIVRGMAEAVGGTPALDADAWARAFRQGQRVAYHGVMQPVEGTILTIIQVIAEASEHAAALSDDIGFLLITSLNKARDALAQTPDLLPILKEAGVVDAGGAGLVYLLEGMTYAVTGEALPAVAPPPTVQPHLESLPDEWGYDIQFLVLDADSDEETIRRELIALGGESIVVGRTGRVAKVHVHGEEPGRFLTYGASLGPLDDIVVENMTLQTLRRKGVELEGITAPARSPGEEALCIPVVAVTPGEGFAQVFRSLGACQIVAGGQTMNPSAEAILQAIESISESEAIVLPNNKNILMAARQAAELSEKRVFVVESRTLPQGVAAMFAYRPQSRAEENADLMRQALADVRTIEVTRAVRQAAIHGVHVQEGAIIALSDGRLCCSGDDPLAVAQRALDVALSEDDGEVVTIYFGQPMDAARAQALAQAVEARHPEVAVEVVAGGQPHYHFIISVE
ncbi:MAG TPA: DAK2 domain-containing protein [Caldilineae bacterium]|nr:DAK2 domain-containing protein [Caldilineae bacterium]